MNAFAGIADAQLWAAPLGWHLLSAVGALLVGTVLGGALAMITSSRQVASALRWATRTVPVLGVLLVAGMLLGRHWWLGIAIGAGWVLAVVWHTITRASVLAPEQALTAEALHLSTTERRRLVRSQARGAISTGVLLGWRRALLVTTVVGFFATGAAGQAAEPAQHAPFGLGMLITVGVRNGDYPMAVAGAVWLLVLAVVGELVLVLVGRVLVGRRRGRTSRILTEG